jgi:hypothetical protein
MARKTTGKTTKKRSKDNKIVLAFDGPVVSPDTFKRAVNAFIELLKAVSNEAAGDGKKIQWNMSVEKGSNVLIARPVPDVETTRASSLVIRALPDGLRRLEKGTPTSPSYFDEKALRAAKDLASIKDGNAKSLDYLQIRSYGKPCEVSERTVSSIGRLLGGQHQALGSIEGRLQTITDRGTLQFVVYDSLFDKGVNCFMDDKIVDQAIKAWRKRVAVSGMVQYDKEGHPVSIRVDTIREFKDVSELPTIKEMRGIFLRG